ncbi:dynamin family protein [Oceanobacillus bengalensis]|uniref:Dynamin N-terminal domain-containing protein n=1 Tax=Oceanobacillus bengalensis TaxID=1435466 RepID=A0A494YSP3_9BACI|nr:dynamin family protein [Oceanobacillus bengalensis]RKQ13145.1 hypothetical protein D8M05_17190 [Oceanobacillus bengalensis]
MNQLKAQKSVKLEQLASLYQVMIQNGDKKNAIKILELYEKRNKNEIMIGFAGHFSAGKSSMINTIVGEDILPKSPIPTSANVVKIYSGEGVARVHLNNGETIEFSEPYDMDVIKEYSKDKDTIKKIELSTAKELVPSGCSIIDTPGIDAADDADRIMTEGSLHLVDYLFYVMDYNHVQSEVNLQFLQSVGEKAIPYYVIVNQIDKHDEEELLFEQFDKRIKQTFDEWNLQPIRLYYSSLLDESVANNQIDEIKETVWTHMAEDELLHMHAAVEQVVTDYKRALKIKHEDTLDRLNDVDLDQGMKELHEKSAELEALKQEADEFGKAFNRELQQTLNNAYLMPAKLRDKAQVFLESQQSNFKVGLFGSKKKTEEEKNKRILDFLTPLKENIEAGIQWKLRDKLLQIIKDYDISNTKLQQDIQQLAIIYTEQDLMNQLKPGAMINGDYVLNYTNDVANDIKNKFKQEARVRFDAIKAYIDSRNREKEAVIQAEISQLSHIRDVKEHREAIQQELKAKFHFIDQQLIDPSIDDDGWKLIHREIKEKEQRIKRIDTPQLLEKKEKQIVSEKEDVKEKETKTSSVASTIRSIEKTIHAIGGLPGFETLLKDLGEKQYRLSNRSYTIALFGAFSAGKSSFANALIGENVLPVSPNPTTATVNRICPVTDQHQHGTVKVTFKNDEALQSDLVAITKKFSPKEKDFGKLLEWVKREKIHQHDGLNKMYQAYLQAMINGFDEIQDVIGDTVIISLENFPTYVTDETKACYIASMDLYYDCSLTRQGITLVDTPGADSVNARHTNVAFDYIKHADAILYVTYYNHALSRADKDFLTQLGRVKEAFELDKMFFIVNAADLATDAEELQLVVNYVQEQLITLGIRLPKLYPVSSKQSLKDKVETRALNEQMQAFEDFFYQFIHHDLVALTIESSVWDINRTYHAINQYIQSLHLDEDEKERRKYELEEKKEKLAREIEGMETSVFDDRIADKIDKQLYYVFERLSIRFHDIFKDYFNPTTITESGKKAIIQLQASLDELIEFVGYELYQELQAVSLRVEAFIQTQGVELHGNMSVKSRSTDELFDLPSWNGAKFETPEYAKAFEEIEKSLFNKALSTFKGTKAFFEKNEKEEMKELIFKVLSPFAKEYIEANKVVMSRHYMAEWQKLVMSIKQEAQQSVNTYVENYVKMIVSEIDISVLVEKQDDIRSILEEHKYEDVS